MFILPILIDRPKLIAGGEESPRKLPAADGEQLCRRAKWSRLKNLIFASKKANTLGPEDELCIRNARRFLTDFRSGPSAVSARNSLEPFARNHNLRRRTTIRPSIRHGFRAQQTSYSTKL